jgi:hypothetical protein
VLSLVKNWPSGSGEEVENVKVYRQTDGWTDGRTDRQTESTKTICLPQDGGRHNYYNCTWLVLRMINILKVH